MQARCLRCFLPDCRLRKDVFVENAESLPVSVDAPKPRIHWIKKPWDWLKGLFFFFVSIILGIFRAIRWVFRTIRWLIGESNFGFRLFLYTTRRFLHVEVYLALIGAFAFFGWIVHKDLATDQRQFLEYCYMYFTMVMIVLAMSLLPRERDEDTLEILWSQPMRRSALVVIQLLTLTVWLLVMCVAVVLFFSYFSAYTEGRWTVVIMTITTAFAVGAITVLVSTFCRHAMATGLVTMLILGAHYFWLRELGPIVMYYNPIPPAGFVFRQGESSMLMTIIFNRAALVFLTGFVLDYLFRRLKRSAEWFT